MEYKTFGPGRWPSDEFKADLTTLLKLDDEQRNAIVQWFLSTRDFDAATVPPEIVASTLLPEQFDEARRVIRLLLDSWQSYGLELADIERDLLLLGYNQDQLAIVSTVLGRLSSVKERAWIDGQHRLQRVLGLPTVTDVNVMWDARPVFGNVACDYYSANTDEGSYRRFLGLTYIAIVEIFTSDSDEQKQRTAIQMDQEQFNRLLAGLNRAGEQLDILRKHTRNMALDIEHAEKGD